MSKKFLKSSTKTPINKIMFYLIISILSFQLSAPCFAMDGDEDEDEDGQIIIQAYQLIEDKDAAIEEADKFISYILNKLTVTVTISDKSMIDAFKNHTLRNHQREFYEWQERVEREAEHCEWANVLLEKCTSLDLTKLDFSDFQPGRALFCQGVSFLSGVPFFNLTKLNLSCNSIRDEGVEHLMRVERPMRLNTKILTELNLSNNFIGDKGASALSRKDLFPKLILLDLSRNEIGQNGAIALNVYFSDILQLQNNPIHMQVNADAEIPHYGPDCGDLAEYVREHEGES